jgi:hypothetical protein
MRARAGDETGDVLYAECRLWQIASDDSGVFRPNADATSTGTWTTGGAGTTGTYWGNVDDDPDAADDESSYVDGPNKTVGTVWLALSSVPVYFAGADTVEIKVKHQEMGGAGASDDRITLEYQIVDGDGSAVGLAAETTFGELADDETGWEVDVAPSLSVSGVNTAASWNGAYLRIRQAYRKAGGPDSLSYGRITAVEVNVTYTPSVRYWVGTLNGGDGTWDDPLCWASASGGATGPGVPDLVQTAVFDGGRLEDATIDTDVVVGGIDITSAYTVGYTITQNTGVTITAGVPGFSQDGGTFAGGNSLIDVAGDFRLTGGVFTSTSDILSVAGNFTHGGGTFNHGNGTLALTASTNTTFAVAATLNHLQIGGTAVVTLEADLAVAGDLAIQAATLDVGANRAISVGGDWSCTGAFLGRSGNVTFLGASGTISSAGMSFSDLVVPSGSVYTATEDL